MHIVTRALKALVSLIAAPIALSLAAETLYLLTDHLGDCALLLIGMASYILVQLFVPHRAIRFVETYAHESSHAVTGMASFKYVRKLIANVDPTTPDEETSVTDIPSGANWLIFLAPYFLPLFSLPVLLLRLLFLPLNLPSWAVGILDFAIGFTLGFHYVSLARNFRPRQTDLPRAGGYVFSTAVTVIFNVVILAATVSVVSEDLDALRWYFVDAWAQAAHIYDALIQLWHRASTKPTI